MKKIVVFFLTVLLATLSLAMKYETVAWKYLSFLSKGEFQKAYEISTDVMKNALPTPKLKAVWNQIEAVYGEYEGVMSVQSFEKGGCEVYVFKARFKNQIMAITISVDKNGKVAGFFFKPLQSIAPYTPPSYVNTSSFKEKDIEVGKYKLKGKLCIPKGIENPPVVIMIQGSGAQDMDESIGPNKPFRDIAWGLATMGIATIRFNKRTQQVPDKMNPKKITVKEEVIEDVISAVSLARSIFPNSLIFALGHSLGAYLASYIVKNESLAGAIMLASPARNVEELMLDQLRYLKKFEEVDDQLIDLVERLIKGDLDPETVVLGAPASYYYDLRNYNPLKYLPGIHALLLFGKKDYQVPPEEAEIFSEKLHGASNVEIKIYKGLNHLFMKTEGVPSPMDYFKEGHVSEQIIRDIANWIKKVCDRG